MRQFQDIPKAELHAHLNGSIPPAAMRSLLADRGLHESPDSGVPAPLLEPVRGLEEYFAPWRLLRALPTDPAALQTLVLAAAQELAADAVTYAELRNSVTYIAKANEVSTAVAVEWLLEAFENAAEVTGVDLRLIACLTRDTANRDTADLLFRALIPHSDHARLVGVDLCGDESVTVPAEIAAFFRKAKERLGLGVTIHAGETGNIENIWWALRQCDADRIGHGLAAAGDPQLMETLVEADVCVEVCLTSNRLTGLVPDIRSHPVVRFHDANVPYVLCTDNPQLHALPLSREYEQLIEIMQDASVLDKMSQRQAEFSFGGRSH